MNPVTEFCKDKTFALIYCTWAIYDPFIGNFEIQNFGMVCFSLIQLI